MASEVLPEIRTAVPGPRSRAFAERLARVECPEVTCLVDPPIFWERASGSNVVDVDGNRFVDLLAGLGVACLGYAHPELAAVIADQAATLSHAMGDVYPARVKLELLEKLAQLLPGDLGSGILSSSGSDAVESALKTALRVTGRPEIIAFEGGYHGLGFGALDVTHREHFRAPFEARLTQETVFVRYGDAAAVREAARSRRVGGIIVEPIQGRGGIRLPPEGFLSELRTIADEVGALLIVDEVYTGLGRTGRWLACQYEGVVPDLVALGKGLGGGFPISACVGRAQVMEKWGASSGEALHSQTHLGNPLGCALASRVLEILERQKLVERASRLGERVLAQLRHELAGCSGVREVRGRGLMLGIELAEAERAEQVVNDALRAGWILLGEGPDGRVLAITPPLTIAENVLDAGLDWIVERLRKG